MADNTLDVRVKLRYDTFAHWMNSSLILLPGEIAIAYFPNSQSIANTNITPDDTPPAVGIKIGDGYSYFYELPWLQAVAGDVYAWAKTATKPTYTANEISGLNTYIDSYIGGGAAGGSGGNTYQIVWDSVSQKYILQYYDEDDEEWKNTTSQIDFSEVLTRINNIERWANGEKNGLGNIDLPITALIYDEVLGYMNKLDAPDSAVAHQFVTQVQQIDGKIYVSRSIISASDITSGTLETAYGGTGLSRVEDNELLIGSNSGNITTRTFVTTFDGANRTDFATVGAILDYVTQMTAGLTGAMHFAGEATVPIDLSVNRRINPQIPDYDFAHAQPGDVILANNAQEYVWTGTEWRLLGDEGSYAIKGSITNADIAEEADIAQDKIAGLVSDLEDKVDKVEGKDLSTNDFDDEYKFKLDHIEDNAQANVIEHIFVNENEILPRTIDGNTKSIQLNIPNFTENDIERLAHAEENVIEHIYVNNTEIDPTTVDGNPKSVNIIYNPYTQQDEDKLAAIEAEAQVNKVETITVNGTTFRPNAEKNVNITLNQQMLNLDVVAGARVPGVTAGSYEDIDITAATKQLELARIAKTGMVHDLLQQANTYIILDCGTSDSDVHPAS